MTQEEKNNLLQLNSKMREQTIKNDQLYNKKENILQRLKYEISGFKAVIKSNYIEAQRKEKLSQKSWQMYHQGKVDAYELIISVLEKFIKEYE